MQRNYLAGQDVFDAQYNGDPVNITPEDKQRFFDPIKIIEDNDELASWLEQYRPSKQTNRVDKAVHSEDTC